MNDVQKAFDGLYKKVNRETQQWYTETHQVPTPRPGAVGISSVVLRVASGQAWSLDHAESKVVWFQTNHEASVNLISLL
jgi:ADP-ribosylglycohydrolase